MYVYRTKFSLEASVNDFEAARDYLKQDEMKPYLKNDKRCSEETYSKIISIDWILKDESSGYIELKTESELTTDELDKISSWVRGQNSDGIGAGFSEQEFACYEDEGLTGYEGDNWDNEYVMASFDWQSNEYKFELVQKD